MCVSLYECVYGDVSCDFVLWVKCVLGVDECLVVLYYELCDVIYEKFLEGIARVIINRFERRNVFML